MKTTLAVLFFLDLYPGFSGAADRWNDALSSVKGIASAPADSLKLQGSGGVPVVPTDPAVAVPVPPAPAVDSSLGTQIIQDHFLQMRSSNLMINTITLENYWIDVFNKAGHPELYGPSRDKIQLALEAGLSPYLRGETITAEQFADRALAALHDADASSATPPSGN